MNSALPHPVRPTSGRLALGIDVGGTKVAGGIVDLETLEQANRDLIDTISGVLSTQEEGRQKRAMVERRMDEMTQELRQALVQGRVT